MYKILFNTIENPSVKRCYDSLKEEGHEVFVLPKGFYKDAIKEEISKMGITPDMLVLSFDKGIFEDININKEFSEIVDFEALTETVAHYASVILEAAEGSIEALRKGSLKRIALLTKETSSVRENSDTAGYPENMAMAAANMVMKILFNKYRPEGFTFRCFADDEKIHGIEASEYFLTEQSFIETDAYIHSDENRLVMRNGQLREITF